MNTIMYTEETVLITKYVGKYMDNHSECKIIEQLKM